ncbi:MAG: hypothetical protein WKF47_14965 [Geodermatophilaceae bacterium]
MDVALFDTFARTRDVDTVLMDSNAHHVAVYSWNLEPDLIKEALSQGASGYLAKDLPAEELVDALERINLGETVVTEEEAGSRPGRRRLARPRPRADRA